MSLRFDRSRVYADRFPRVSGDEPCVLFKRIMRFWFSPRERG